ncbi:MAG: hypothetical protein ACHBN1_19690 [Heteroscytonema crispum UTEX LB 1556]
MLKVTLEGDVLGAARLRIRIGERFSVSFQRTLRIPDDGRTYPLPPSLGTFPIHRVADFSDRVTAKWREQGGYFIPMYQREALWLGFDGASWKPNAVKIAIGKVNAISGEAWDETLHADPQNYIVCPDQPWLDGINAGNGFIRQFVAMPLGLGYTVEAQISGAEEFGGIQILVYEPKPGTFADEPPPTRSLGFDMLSAASLSIAEMGLGAGGKMQQKIYPDSYGIDTWDTENYGSVFVHIVNSEQYRELTGFEAPPTPITAQIYTQYGLPWFSLYDETQGDLPASEKLSEVKTVQEQDLDEQDNETVDIAQSQIEKLHHPPLEKGDSQN